MGKILDRLTKNNIISFSFISLVLMVLFGVDYFFWDENILLVIIFFLFEGINLLRLKYSKEIIYFINKVIDHRYIVALLIFLICVSFKLHGSSIGVYNEMILEQVNVEETSEILGVPRLIRSDEWRAHTPYYFSQQYNDFLLESHQMSISGQDMTVGYNAPVINITEICKPQSWGYILFGNEVGISWYWCFQLILLCLGSFDLIMILTKKNRLLSFLGLMLIGFSPELHWWFVPHVTIVFMWGMILTNLGYHFFVTRSEKKRILISIALAISNCAFVLALFPSCQIPVGMISLILMLVFLVRDREEITFSKKNLILLFFIVIFVIGMLAYFLATSKDALGYVLNTIYPGERLSRGQDSNFSDLFSDLTVIFLPYKNITYLNNCEVSDFIHLGPLFLGLFPFIAKKIDKKDLLPGKVMVIMLLIQIIYMCCGFPELLARITLFSKINRMSISYGFLATIFMIWGIDVLQKNKKLWKDKTTLLISILFALIYLSLISDLWLDYVPIYAYVLEVMVYMLVVYLILSKKIKLVVIIFSAMIMMASFTINPIVKGTSAITNHKLYEEVEKIISADDSNWLVLNDLNISGYLLAAGAKVINGVNYYPDMEKWKAMDPEFKYRDIYNRYAHIEISIAEDVDYEIYAADSIRVKIKEEDLKKWKIKYLFSSGKMTDYLKNTRYKVLYEDIQSDYYIYEISMDKTQ